MLNLLPNLISILRIFLAISLPFVPQGFMLPLIILCGISDFLDGFLARALNCESTLGKILDPMGDKIFSLSLICIFWKILPKFFLKFIIVRDLLILGGSLILNRNFCMGNNYINVSLLGKIYTCALMFYFAMEGIAHLALDGKLWLNSFLIGKIMLNHTHICRLLICSIGIASLLDYLMQGIHFQNTNKNL